MLYVQYKVLDDKGYLFVKVRKDVYLKGMLFVKFVFIRYFDSFIGMER